MKKKHQSVIKTIFKSTFLLFLFALNSCKEQTASIIPITKDMVINETGYGKHMAWFDEQEANETPTTRWETYGVKTYWPAGIIIDFGSKYKIREILIFDGEKERNISGGELQVSTGAPFNWQDSIKVQMDNANSWITLNCNYETRYLHLEKLATNFYNQSAEFPENCDLAIKEVIIKGYPLEDTSPKVTQTTPENFGITMDEFIGMNSYITIPDKLHEAIGLVREYRPWGWNGVTDLETPINWGDLNEVAGKEKYPQADMNNSDLYYQKMKDMGIEAVPCIHRHVDQANEHENIPNFGGNPNDPLSYKIMADYSFQYVARYGNQKVSENLLRTTEASPKKSGMGFINYFENWNEPNRWWGDPAGHFTPYQFAAFCSASYDGHLNQMGDGFGVKNADPNTKYVFGGLAELSLSYVQAMKLWADHHRDGSFPADVINLHHYCNTRGKQHSGEEAHGISPEADGLKEKLEKIVAWRDKHLPDKELWLSEFGWDTDEGSYQSAAFGHALYPDKISMFEIQGQWLVREYLIGAGAGIDRMMMYLANDLKNYQHDVFGECGFVTVDDELKPSWYYVKTLKDALSGMTFQAEQNSDNENVWIYKFSNPETKEGAYVLWCPTSDGTTVNNFSLPLSDTSQTATEIKLEHQQEAGISTELNIENNTVTVNVTERPLIILVDQL
ncbi:hypothetical protein [Chondrinema litorale]|uniref:hypothetical protein n=1 Tax=Chondrinema litorale TaxID=2994555 RepID=UPI0025434F21|nr:hypothetical protein [Chondrinema litorale]UZR95289.1 hypothetical protein OQ292_05580 [Chondrinema litorale]